MTASNGRFLIGGGTAVAKQWTLENKVENKNKFPERGREFNNNNQKKRQKPNFFHLGLFWFYFVFLCPFCQMPMCGHPK